MARNKYPEETVKRILDVSLELFMKQGFENTSIQDIINHLGGLTKGAIYHHFKSKEDIMVAVLERSMSGQDVFWQQLLDKSDLTGLEKLQKLFDYSIAKINQSGIFNSAPDMLKNSKMLVLQLEGIMRESAPKFVAPIIEQGIADGSIVTDYPVQLAEVILLLFNLWVTPMLLYAEPEVMQKRALFLKEMLESMGVPLIDDIMIKNMDELAKTYSAHR